MNIHLIAVGARMPSWVAEGYAEYAKRLPAESSLRLVEIPALRRLKGASVTQLVEREGERMLAAIPKDCTVLALDVNGREWDTEQLAQQLGDWLAGGRDVALLVGGPDGLAPACLARAQQAWSLSKLTLPHPLVRVVLAEQLYRAWTILRHHPYHRG